MSRSAAERRPFARMVAREAKIRTQKQSEDDGEGEIGIGGEELEHVRGPQFGRT
eukprot:CAMPEP_0194291776 /NCGR_PEP_ID=MMETSP0169-20130528/44185_1 /TAXON_ID=218684 /ORGANISM="Corethron pennatum, Strain L29A3" /LENGTH=53 /DNA_ID=CAMNT_0039039765 /DNA_START=188 /DNA_END=345 /DNA_ORIENTATION=+